MSARVTKQILRATVLVDEPSKTKGKAAGKSKSGVAAKTKSLKKRRQFLDEARIERSKSDNTAKNIAVLTKLTKTTKAQDLMKKILKQTQRL
ncbi:hypothetical protein SPRG_09491 [Saprolegnia parasitica CBS 223.65]|uniref:Uncharacterized protein n=1 Tax=Saprolegnia parasitica (strain CBS 223.65) TaxID=695850 RepID=A0A067C3B5_SAPPC|nr:hypothetical protein SPRG_09491 [Saprolegnia parasitica CBS 223.65]KDO25244.1 hypothetical protein SPRG_09491 [Saprolegnia parasitica CBS 223.65]|eukprot:XP_012204078.1 hypothetical protein SPRG_09491 [Saprolegnia parasitica CBS 223.65]